MRKIQILGTGCSKCENLRIAVERLVKELNIECEITKVSDINEILSFGVMMIPGLVIDRKVKSSGKVPSEADLKKYLTE
jgi:small redox-active disulfide protein 2